MVLITYDLLPALTGAGAANATPFKEARVS
jgi:hypothetical protein